MRMTRIDFLRNAECILGKLELSEKLASFRSGPVPFGACICSNVETIHS